MEQGDAFRSGIFSVIRVRLFLTRAYNCLSPVLSGLAVCAGGAACGGFADRSGCRFGCALRCSLEIVASVVTLPSRPIFRTRGSQPSLRWPLALVYSSTYISSPCTAIPVGDHGRSAFNTVLTLPSAVIFTTPRQPEAAAYTLPCESTSRPRIK